MPELPEIETIRKSLMEIVGRRVTGVNFSRLAPVETTTPAEIRRALTGAEISAVTRWGKYLLLHGARGAALVIHLGMSGQLRLYPSEKTSKENHIHLRIFFADGSVLQFRDARRFGTLSLSRNPDGSDNSFLARLGPDYLDPDFSDKAFVSRCRRHPGITLKALTLHQGVGAGLGNIYGCEALYRARLDPRRRVRDTTDAQLKKLLAAIRESLQLGIRYCGVSLRDYMDGKGTRGTMKDYLLVYDRKDAMALDGGGKVKRIVQNARSTWFVPAVQK
jgi:formamidopyrimidine-DNA glycosylase